MKELYEKKLSNRRYKRRRLFLDLLSEIGEEMDSREIYELITDAVPFLFGAEDAGLVLSESDRPHHAGTEGIRERAGRLFPSGPAIIDGTTFENADRLYDSIVEFSSSLTSSERASLMLPEKDRRELFIKSVKGIDRREAGSVRIPIGEGIAGKVYKEGIPLLVTDMARELSMQKKKNYQTGSFVSLPLRIGGEPIGVLNLADRLNGATFSEKDRALLQHIASCASVTIRGAQCCVQFEEMRTLCITDSLTGLFNRRYFDERLCEELHRCARYDSFFSLAILDIDNFKLFNDTEGHLAGDEVLRAVKDISRESLRSIDVIARFGGEEFAVIMPQTEKDEAFLVAERIRNNIRKTMSGRWTNFPRRDLTVSIGIASFPVDGRDEKTLIRNADKALYQAKISGKNRTVACNPT